MSQEPLKEALVLWLQKCYQQLQQAPLKVRIPLCIGEEQIGSIELGIAQELVEAGLLSQYPYGLSISEIHAQQKLEEVSKWLEAHQLSATRTGEMLPVNDVNGNTLAGIERAAVRTLGITTHPVYLIGRHEHGSLWLQRRALTKKTGAGKLDILVGGLVSINETHEQALKREAWEEAGIDLGNDTLVLGGTTYICRPVDSEYGGYMVEMGHWYEKVLPSTFEPVNQDGEVQEFLLCTEEEIKGYMLMDALAPESAWVLARYFGWQ